MSTVRNSYVFVKVTMVLMIVLSVLISGCIGNDEEEWKKKKTAYSISYSILWGNYNNREHERMKRPLSEWDARQRDSFYIARAEVIKLEEKLKELEKMAKGKKEREEHVKILKIELDKTKTAVIGTGKFSRIVPKEHLNFDKNVSVPVVEDKNKGNQANAKKETEVKTETNKTNQPKQTSTVEKKDVENKGNVGVITGTEVRFRQEGNLNGKILGHFEKGEKVTVLEKGDKWSKVQRQDGTVGYVSNDFCK